LPVILTLALIINDQNKNISTYCVNIHEGNVSLIEIWDIINN